MVAIFTGLGAGAERGSGNVLGGAGLLGGGTLGRSGEQVLLNAATGNLMIEQQDEMLTGRGLDASISRTYNSLGNLSDENGDNWRQSTDRRVYGLTGTVNTAGSTVKRVSADGSEITYTWNTGANAYIATDGSGAYDKLTWNAGTSVWTWTDGDSQVTETYGQLIGGQYFITKQTDTSGNTLTFSYVAGTSHVDKVTTANGEYIQYSWTGNNTTQMVTGYTDLTTSTAKTLTRTRYSYDGSNRLSTVTVDLSPEDNSIADGKVYTTTYGYDGTSTRVASITETDGTSLAIGYDASGRVHTLTQTVASGVTRTTTIDYLTSYTNITDALGQVTRLDYDGNDQLKRIVAPATPGAQQLTYFYYTAAGDVDHIVDAVGNTTTYTYDGNGNVLTVTDPLNHVISRTYNAQNQVVTETRTGSSRGPSEVQLTTRYAYDDKGRLRFKVDERGSVVEYRYDSYGNRTQIIEPWWQLYTLTGLNPTDTLSEAQLANFVATLIDGTTVQQQKLDYDVRGNLMQVSSYGNSTSPGVGSTTGADGWSKTTYVYDQAGLLRSRTTYPYGAETFVYDGLGRLTASVDRNNASTSIQFQDASTTTVVTLASGLVQTSTYNKAGELVSFTESGSYTTVGTASYTYDQDGRLRATTDAAGNKSYLEYDNVGRKIADIDQYGNVVEYKYDKDNRLVATVRYATALTSAQLSSLQGAPATFDFASNRPGAAAGDVWSWTVYDAAGNKAEVIDGDGNVVYYQYDSSNLLVRTTNFANQLTSAQLATFKVTPPATAVLPTADGTRDIVERLFYWPSGELLGKLDGAGYLTQYQSDARGNVYGVQRYDTQVSSASLRATGGFGEILTSIGANSPARSSFNIYDEQGLLTFTIDDAGHVTEYVHRSVGDAGDANGVVREVIQYSGVLDMSGIVQHTPEGMRSVMASAGFYTATDNRYSYSVYDTHGNLAYAIDPEGSVTAYQYDVMGNVTKVTQFAAQRPTTALPDLQTMDTWAGGQVNVANNRVTRNYYDARGELRYTIDAEGYVSRIDYDANGRTVGTTRWDAKITATLTVTDATTIAQVAAAATGTYVATATSYDADGRVLTTTDGANVVTRYAYNANGTLESTYQANGTADEVRTRYVYDAAGRVQTRYDAYLTSEQQATSFAYDAFGNKLSETDATGATTSWTYDLAGNVLTETDALTNVTHYEYNAFGEVVKTTDPLGGITYNYYDTLGRVVLVRDAENYGTKYEYTAFGEVKTVTRYGARTTDAASTTTLPTFPPDAADAVTQFTYDKLGRLKRTTDALNNWEENTYNAFGQVSQNQGKLGLITNYTYDRRGLLSTVVVNAPVYNSAGTQVAASYTSHSYGYDARGNMTSDTEALGLAEQRVTTYVYDKLNRVIEKHLPQVQNSTNTGLVSPVEYYSYDGRGNLIQTKDAAGARTLSYYDHLNRVTVQIDPLGGYSTFTYTIVAGTGSNVVTKSYDTALATLPTNPGGTPPAAPAGTFRQTTSNYNKLGQLTSTVVTGVLTGKLVGSTYTTNASTTLTTAYSYDANGNVVTVTDPNGGVTYSYYDKLGRKSAQVDAGRYLTSWTLDTNGNALGETRYANAVASSVTAATLAGSTAAALPSLLGTGAADADRTTNFTYDKMGRRLTETRTGLTYWTINPTATTGALTLVTNGSSTITYTYNALGEVWTKVEAATNTGSSTHDTTTYTYDSAGRLTRTAGASFTDYAGNNVQGILDYSYDALGDVVRTVQNSARVTTYSYGAGGRLQSTTDPSNATHTYFYDLAGRKIGDAYDRAKSNGTILHEGISYQYDLNGNLTRQAFATVSSGVFTDAGDVTGIVYNAHGEATSRSLNGVVQGQYRYDNAGRLEATNANGGVWSYYLYDANGNQTAKIDDEGNPGVNLVNQTLATVLSIATAGGSAAIGGSYIDGVNATLTTYDARNQALSSTQTKRQLTSTGTPTDLTSSQTYNAFGEVLTQVDALNYTTTYTYNTMGRTLSVKHPTTTVTGTNGVDNTSATPTEYYYYDASGRLIGQMDANGNVVTRSLLAGTGYGQSDALVVNEYHPDGGVAKNGYDVFGDLRKVTDEISRVTNNTYDAMGRLTQVSHYGGLVDTYTYDALGQRTKHTNNSASDAETTDYDVQGRVVIQVAFGGDTTTTSYVWSGTMATTGLGTFGGYTQTTTYQNSMTSSEKDDAFGHVISQTDMGGHVYNYTYDTAGRVITKAPVLVPIDTLNYTYYNTGLVGTIIKGFYGTAANGDAYDYSRMVYGYDKMGRDVSEVWDRQSGGWYEQGHVDPHTGEWIDDGSVYLSSGAVLQQSTAQYDALGRMIRYDQTVNNATRPATITWKYDAVGNIREKKALHYDLPGDGSPVTTQSTEDDWYLYDSMNRMTLDRGSLVSGAIVRGDAGTAIEYDTAGERTRATSSVRLNAYVWNPSGGQDGYGGYDPQTYLGYRREDYTYTSAGNLYQIYVAETGYDDNGNGTLTVTAPPATGTLTGIYTYDLMNRVTQQKDYSNATTVAYQRDVTYNAKGQVDHDVVSQLVGSGSTTTTTYYGYGTGTGYALGTAISTSWTATGSSSGSGGTTTQLYWYAGAQTYKTTTSQAGTTSYDSTFTYDGYGTVTAIAVGGAKAHNVSLYNDMNGQVVIRQDFAITAQTPADNWYRFAGRQIGYIGNNGTENTDYLTSVQSRGATGTGYFRGGASSGVSYADFDQAYDHYTSYSQGSSGGSYTVQNGDTLSGIAQNLWGDANLWYKLAQANGLSSDAGLVQGQTLTIPAGVSRTSNTSSTFRPYDPSDAVGDISGINPVPKPKNKNNCGVFGQILLVAIAVAVTIASHGALTHFAAGILGSSATSAGAVVLGGALSAAAGSIASQTFGVASGIQQSFSWKGVALAALGGAVGGALGEGGVFGKAGAFGDIGSKVATDLLRGVATSAITQGIGVATGLQKNFDWVGVAAAGIGAAAGGAVGRAIKFDSGMTGFHLGNALKGAVAGSADAIANAAARSVIEGSDFGDNVLAALPGVIGNTVGSLIGGAVFGSDPKNDTDRPALALNAVVSVGSPPNDRYDNFFDENGQILSEDFVDDLPQTLPNASQTADAEGRPDDIVVTARRDRRLEAMTDAQFAAYLAAHPQDGTRDIGVLTRKYETGNRGPGVISSGQGDAGGKSYGSYQLASKRGRPMDFLANQGKKWASEFDGLAPYGDAFDNKWREIAAREPDDFLDAQTEYMKKNYYDKAVDNVNAATGIDLDARSDAVANAVLSVATQMGPGKLKDGELTGASLILKRAIWWTSVDGVSPDSPDYDTTLLNNIYKARTQYAYRVKAQDIRQSQNMKLSPQSRANYAAYAKQMQSVIDHRYPNELADAQIILKNER